MTHRKDGRWQEVVSINGKQKYFYGHTKAEVLRKVNEYQAAQERGRLFKEVAEEWWEYAEPKLEYNTVKSYRPAYRRAIESLGNQPIKDITPADISREIKLFARTRARKTVCTQRIVYNQVFKHAVEMGYVMFNPVRDISVPSGLSKRKVTAPSAEDIARVKNSTDCTFGMFAYWAMYTGMRRGELLALEWNDVDIKNRTIRVTKSVYHVNNRPKIKQPKTESGIRVLPILDKLLEKIKPRRSGLVFPNQDGELITETQFQRLWELYCQESGIRCTPHQLRHAFATMLYENNIPAKDAQDLLGHAQLSTTMDIYTDIRESQRAKIHQAVYCVDIV